MFNYVSNHIRSLSGLFTVKTHSMFEVIIKFTFIFVTIKKLEEIFVLSWGCICVKLVNCAN